MHYVEGFMAALRSHMISLVCNYFLCGAVVKALKAFTQTITGEVGNLCTTTEENYTCLLFYPAPCLALVRHTDT